MAGYLRWCLAFVRRHPLVSILVASGLAALIGGAFLFELATIRLLSWNLVQWAVFVAVMATGIGYLSSCTRRSLRMFGAKLKQVAEKTETDLHRDRTKAKDSRQKLLKEMTAMRAELAEIATLRKLCGLLDERIAGVANSLDEAQGGFNEQLSALTNRIDEAQGGFNEQLSALTNRIDEAQGGFNEQLSALTNRIDEAVIQQLQTEIRQVREQSVSLDTVSVLRAMQALWIGRTGAKAPASTNTREHGHALLMAVLVDEAVQRPDLLPGKTLVEIGTTRECDPGQKSTEKLGIFTAMLGMRFITVDMDPINTAHARRVLSYINPLSHAITAKGEDYLASLSEPLDYIYLDAFDFDHGKHSEDRQLRYRVNLKTVISDDACWHMHLQCAQSIITKMEEGGIVVIDDTWTDGNGEFDGKGKLAVPLLLAHGFEIIARTPMAIALQRSSSVMPKRPKRSPSNKRTDRRDGRS